MAGKDALPLPKSRYGVAISWDRAKSSVDLDLQAVIVDDHGLIVDAVYYNNLSAFGGCVGHSGDKKLADGRVYSESVWVNLGKLPKQVALIIYVVAAYGDCMLKDVTGGKISVLEDWFGCRVRELRIERAMADVDAVFMMRRTDDGWKLLDIEDPPVVGSHFLDILEPTIGDLIRKEIPGAPASQKVTFWMDKGGSIDFRETSELKRLTVGISASLPRGYQGCVDVDISAVLFSRAGKIIGAVDCDKNEKYGVAHCGDQVAGSSTHDDEVVTIDLLQVPQKVVQIFFLLTVRGGQSFQAVDSAYARVADQSCTELARYDIAGGTPENGLIIARIFRGTEKRWSLQALGMFVMAEKWQDAVEVLRTLFTEKPHEQVHPAPNHHATAMASTRSESSLPLSRRFSSRRASTVAPSADGADFKFTRSLDSTVSQRERKRISERAMKRAGSEGVKAAMQSEKSNDSRSKGPVLLEPPVPEARRLLDAKQPSSSSIVDSEQDIVSETNSTSAKEMVPKIRPQLARAKSRCSTTAEGEDHSDWGGRRQVSEDRVVMGHGMFRLIPQAPDTTDDVDATDEPVVEETRPMSPVEVVKAKFAMSDADMVPVDDECTAPPAKPRGLCAATGCSWAYRMPFWGGCAGTTAS